LQADLVLRAKARADGVITIHAAGVIDAHTLDKFENGLKQALARGAKSLLLDLEEVRYVNSSGFGEIIRYFDRLRAKGGTLVLSRVPPKVGVILEMLGLKSLIPLAPSIPAGLKLAEQGAGAAPEASPSVPSGPGIPGEPGGGKGGAGADRSGSALGAPAEPVSTLNRLPTESGGVRVRSNRPVLTTDKRTVVCPFCDTRLRIGGEGRWACAACGAPFTGTREGGIAFDWSRADAEAMHMTFDVSPRTLAALAGLIEGVLVERRVSHARMRRFAREAAHVCHLIAEHAFDDQRRGPLHVLLLAGPQRLHIRLVDRGRSLAEQQQRLFSTQSRLFLDFRYASPVEGVNVTEFAFAYAGGGVFAT